MTDTISKLFANSTDAYDRLHLQLFGGNNPAPALRALEDFAVAAKAASTRIEALLEDLRRNPRTIRPTLRRIEDAIGRPTGKER